MRVKDMHPLCCITLDGGGGSGGSHDGGGGGGKESPGSAHEAEEDYTLSHLSRTGSLKRCPTMPGRGGGSSISIGIGNVGGSDVSVAGPLYKWTNYGKGWRSRWFMLRGDGLLSYSKTPQQQQQQQLHSLSSNVTLDGVRVIGCDVTSSSSSSARLSRMDSCGRKKKHHRNKHHGGGGGGSSSSGSASVVHLKVSSFRESRSDDRRFYIFTATKTLHLRTNSKHERDLWVEALASTRSLFSRKRLNENLSISPGSFSVCTERLKRRLGEDGVSDSLVNDCEQIMLSEFSEVQGKLKVLCEERSNLLDTLRQLEAANIETEAPGITDSEFQLSKRGDSSRAKYSECSTTESSDETEKQEVEEASEEEDLCFYDTKDFFSESPAHCGTRKDISDSVSNHMETETDDMKNARPSSHVERRQKLPDPAEKEKAVSLWSMIKDNVGKDLTRVCLPVYFNEPLSTLQKCCEDLEYSYLLDRAYEYGKMGNSLMRIVYVAAFAVSGYASCEGRLCKPFNPLLGETYEADYPEKGIRFFSEKVSHHPTLIACHCEGKGWKFWADSNLKTKFWGQSIQLDPVGILTLEFDDGERFQWSKVTTSIYNLIIGKINLDHHGTMHIKGNRDYSCSIKFKGQSFLERNPRQVHGFVEDVKGSKIATVFGKWDDSIYFVNGDGTKKHKDLNSSSDASLLWRRVRPTPNLTRYNLTSFAITLNEVTPGLKEKLPPTDSRLRPDQRYLENGEYEKANFEKQRLEKRQRMSRKIQEDGWKPKWFEREGEDGPYIYKGGYWEARDQGHWDACPDIFGEVFEDLNCAKEK